MIRKERRNISKFSHLLRRFTWLGMNYLHLFQLLLLMSPVRRVLLFDPTAEMPFTEILGSSSQISTIGNSLKCADERSDTRTCAEECLTNSEQGDACAGFLQRGTTCYLCEVLDASQIDSGQGTKIMPEDKLYILQSPRVDPDIYISMDEYDLSSQIITGIGVTGTSTGIIASDLISDGKVGQAIYLHDANRIVVDSVQPECFCNFALCNGTLSVSFWVKSFGTSARLQSIIRALNVNNGLVIRIQKNTYELQGILYTQEFQLNYVSNSDISSDWTFVVVTANINTGIAMYFDGIKDKFVSVNAAASANYHSGCAQVVMGIKNPGVPNPANSYLDELKYFYRELTDTDVWREYLHYEGLDVTLQLVIPSGDVNPTTASSLVDNNTTSCINTDPCLNSGLKVYYTARNESNFRVTVYSDIMTCNYQSIIVYGTQRRSYQFVVQHRHFVGGCTLRRSIPNSAINQCKFVSESTVRWY